MIVSCQILTATTSVFGAGIACSASEDEQSYPDEGAEANIALSLRIMDADQSLEFTGIAWCKYQGSICGGSSWFHLLHEDQSISHEFKFSSGDDLSFSPHTFSIRLDPFQKSCASGNFDPYAHFILRVMFANKRYGQDRPLVTESELRAYGFKVEKSNIEVVRENL